MSQRTITKREDLGEGAGRIEDAFALKSATLIIHPFLSKRKVWINPKERGL